MEILILWLIFLVSLSGLIFSADRFVLGAINLAEKLDIPKAIIGVTVVALGTSAPELVLTITAALAGESSIALGNVVGSNISNVAVVIGICAIFSSELLTQKPKKSKIVTLVAATTIFSLIILFSKLIDHKLGIILLTSGVLAILYLFKEQEIENDAQSLVTHNSNVIAVNIIFGAVFLPLCSHFLVDSGVQIAESYNISKLLVGLILLAIGTSLPELATSISAVLRKENELVIGNVIGSNIFNLSLVLGSAAVVSPIEIEEIIVKRDLPYMIVLTIILIVSHKVVPKYLSRYLGIMLILSYIVYIYVCL